MIEIYSESRLIENGHRTVSIITENYGFGGKLFIDYIKKIPYNELDGLFKQKYDELMSISNTEEKQAYNMAVLLLADTLACQCIFPEEIPLTANDVKDYMFSKKEIDISERAYENILDVCNINEKHFYRPDTSDNWTQGEFWGSMKKNQIIINAKQLEKLLSDDGFSPKKILKDWSKKRIY